MQRKMVALADWMYAWTSKIPNLSWWALGNS